MWLLLHRHNDPERSGFVGVTPLLIETDSGCMVSPRMLSGKSQGCWLRISTDEGRGGIWVNESFQDICDKLNIVMPGEDWNAWLT